MSVRWNDKVAKWYGQNSFVVELVRRTRYLTALDIIPGLGTHDSLRSGEINITVM